MKRRTMKAKARTRTGLLAEVTSFHLKVEGIGVSEVVLCVDEAMSGVNDNAVGTKLHRAAWIFVFLWLLEVPFHLPPHSHLQSLLQPTHVNNSRLETAD